MLIRKLSCSTLAATALCLGGMGTSVAQDSASMAGLEEIIVTARKKAETLIETPVAVSVLTSEDIEAKGVRDLYDVALFTPTSMPSKTSLALRSSAVSRKPT